MILTTVVHNIFSNVFRCKTQDVICRLMATKPQRFRNREPRTLRVANKPVSTESAQNVDEDAPVEMENPFKQEKTKCLLCKLNIEPDYKNVRLLSQFQSRHTGRIFEKHITGLCSHKQAAVEREIHKAQQAGLMGFCTKDIRYVYDPPLFDPNHPFRPHKY